MQPSYATTRSGQPTSRMVDSPRKPYAYIRLTPAQKTRLATCLSFTGQTEQAFCQAAILQHIEATESDRDQRADAKRKRGTEPGKTSGGLFSQNPTPTAQRKAEPESWTPPAPVVVNVGAGGGEDAIASRLAAYIASKPSHERERAKREVASTIAVVAGTREEQESLRRLVDAKSGQKTDSLLERIGKALLP